MNRPKIYQLDDCVAIEWEPGDITYLWPHQARLLISDSKVREELRHASRPKKPHATAIDGAEPIDSV